MEEWPLSFLSFFLIHDTSSSPIQFIRAVDLMEPRTRWWLTSLLLLFFFLSSVAMNSSTYSIDSLDAVIRDSALNELSQRRTGTVYKVPLPPNLAGIEASVERLRSGHIWTKGTRLVSIRIPPRTTSVPFVRRLAVVHQDLGNWSSSVFTLPSGYALVAPVIGFLAYDAPANSSSIETKEIDLRVLGDPITIAFPRVTLPRGANATVRCARLGPRGSAEIGDAAAGNACEAERTGHFAMVVPWVQVAEAPAGDGRWWVWAVGIGGGAVGLVLVGSIGVGIIRVRRRRRMECMERRAEEDEDLGGVLAGRSNMPSAAMCRTQPVIEDDIVP